MAKPKTADQAPAKTPHDEALGHIEALKSLTADMKFPVAGGAETSVHAQLRELFSNAERTIKAHATTARA